MKYCWSCGAELRGINPLFCNECGIKLDDGKHQPTRTVGASGHVNVTVSNDFREAQRLYQINAYNLALTYIDNAISKNPQNTDYYNLKADILKHLNRFNESAQALVESLKIKENLNARYQMAYMLALGGDKNSIKIFKHAESNYKGNAEYYAKLAGLYFINENYAQTIKEADNSLSIDSRNGLGWFYKGCAYIFEENIKNSIKSLEESFKYLDKSSQDLPAAYFFRACSFIIMVNLFLNNNDHDIFPMLLQAVQDVQDGNKIFQANFNKNNDYLFLNYAMDMMKAVLNYLIQHNYFGIDFHTKFGIQVARNLQDLTDEYEKIRADDTVILKMKGDIYGRLGFHDKAVEYFDKVLKTKRS